MIISFLYKYVWIHLPDYIAVIFAVLLAIHLKYDLLSIRYIVIPTLIYLFLIVIFLQKDNERKNFSILLVESYFTRILGYCSYSLCK